MKRLVTFFGLAAVLMAGGCNRFDQLQSADAEPIPTERDDDWREGGGWDGEFRTLISFSSISHEDAHGSDELTYVWVLRKFAKPQQPDAEDEDEYNREYARFAIDCENSKLAPIAVERYFRERQVFDKVDRENDADEDAVSRKDVPGYQWEFARAHPGSYQHEFVKAVCKEMAKQDSAPKRRSARE